MPNLVPVEQQIQVIACPHPFRAERLVLDLVPGQTVAQLLEKVQPNAELRRQAIISVNGEIIHQDMWATTIPRGGSRITIRVIPASRGIAMIFVAIAAVIASAVTWYAGGVGGWGLWAAFAAMAVSTAVSVGGSLLVNALIPPANTKSTALASTPTSVSALTSSASSTTEQNPTYFISGASNQLVRYGVIPSLLGYHRIMPMKIVRDYNEIGGSEQYARCFFGQHGPIEITDVKIGDTTVYAYSNATIEICLGWPGPDGITLWQGIIHQEDLSILFDDCGTWAIRTTQPNADGFWADIVWPSGLYGYDSITGDKTLTGGVIEFSYRDINSDGPWTLISGVAQQGATTSAVRGATGIMFPYRGQFYILAVRKHAKLASTAGQADCYWTALRTLKNVNTVLFSLPLAKIAARIQASNQLSGTIDELNFYGRSYFPDWDYATGTWITRCTNNPASLLRGVLQGQAAPDLIADSRIDLTQLQYWHEYCQTEGWTYNRNIDESMNWWDLCNEIAAAGRAAMSMFDGKYSVILDESNPATVTMFNSRTMKDLEVEITYPDMPHAFRCPFRNEYANFIDDEYIVLNDGYQIDGKDAFGNLAPNLPVATKFEQLDLPGVTSHWNIWRLARYHLAAAKLRFRKITFTTNVQQLVCTRGDKIVIAHDVMEVGLSYGRVKAMVCGGPNYKTNPGFESAPGSEWYNWHGHATLDYQSIDQAYDGSHSCKVTIPASQVSEEGLGSGETITVSERQLIKITARVYHVSGCAPCLTLWDAEIATQYFYPPSTIIGEWQELTVTYYTVGSTGIAWAIVGSVVGEASLFYIDATGVQTEIVSVTLDETVPMEAGTYYGLQFRVPGELPFNRMVTTEPGETQTLTFAVPIPAGTTKLGVGDLATFGIFDEETIPVIIKNIQQKSGLWATLTCVDEAPGIHLADQAPIPAWESKLTAQPATYAPTPGVVRSDGTVMIKTLNGWQVRILVSFSTTNFAFVGNIGVEAVFRIAGASAGDVMIPMARLEAGEISLMPVTVGQIYSYRLRYVKYGGLAGKWSDWYSHRVVGPSYLPDITNLNSFYRENRVVLTWNAIINYPGVTYEIRKGSVWATAEVLGRIAGTEYVAMGDGNYWISAYSDYAISQNPVGCEIVGSSLPVNVVAVHDEYDDGWTGAKTNVEVDGSGYLTLAPVNGMMYNDELMYSDEMMYVTPNFFEPSGSYEVPVGNVVDVGQDMLCSVAASYLMVANCVSLTMYDDELMYSDQMMFGPTSEFVGIKVQLNVYYSGAWLGWQAFYPGSYVGQKFKMRLLLTTIQSETTPLVESFIWSVDMPDRLITQSCDVLDTGISVSFTPPFQVAPKVTTQILGASQGDDAIISNLTASGMDLIVHNGGVGVHRPDVHVFAKGY